MISASRDGDLLAALIERFGYGTVRGSSSRKGASALLRLVEVFAEGTHIVITPDGPRGPVYQLDQGVIFLAQKCDAAVVPTNMEYSSCWRFKSWDRFIRAASFFQGASDLRCSASDRQPPRARKNSRANGSACKMR